MTALLLLTLAAAPEPATQWGLRWLAPAECRQAADVSRAVEDLLKKPVFGPEPKLLVDGAVERVDGEWRARLALVDEKGTVLGNRDVTSRDEPCSSLDKKVTLVVALLIDPTASLRGPETPPPAAAPELPPPPPRPREGLFDDGPRVRLTLESDPPTVKLHRVVVEGTTGRGSLRGTTVICDKPCVTLVPQGDRFYVTGDGILPTPEFSLPKASDVLLKVRGGSMGAWSAGLVLASLGLSAAIGGLVGAIVGAASNRGELTLGMSALLVGGIGMTIGGGFLASSAQTELEFTPPP